MRALRSLPGALTIVMVVGAVIGMALLAIGLPRASQEHTASLSVKVATATSIGLRHPLLGGLPASPGPGGLMPTACATMGASVDGVYWPNGDYGYPAGTVFNSARAVGSNGDGYDLVAGVVTLDNASPTRQGLIGVMPLGGPCISYANPFVTYDTPTQEGVVWFTSVNGDVATYETAKGNIGTFNYVTAQYGPEHPDPSFVATPGDYGTPPSAQG